MQNASPASCFHDPRRLVVNSRARYRKIRSYQVYVCVYAVIPGRSISTCIPNNEQRSVDCWALGVLTFEYTAGYTPFQAPGDPGDITALFTRIAGSKVATSESIFPPGYDEKVRCNLFDFLIITHRRGALTQYNKSTPTRSADDIWSVHRSFSIFGFV